MPYSFQFQGPCLRLVFLLRQVVAGVGLSAQNQLTIGQLDCNSRALRLARKSQAFHGFFDVLLREKLGQVEVAGKKSSSMFLLDSLLSVW